MQITLEGEFGKGVAGAIELFHSGFEFLAVTSCQDQFSLYRQVNIHLFNMPRVFYLRQVFYMRKGGAFLSTQNEAFVGGVSCAKKDE